MGLVVVCRPGVLHGALALQHDPAHVWCQAAQMSFAWSWAVCNLLAVLLEKKRLPSFQWQSVQYPSVPKQSARKQFLDRIRDSCCFAAQTCYDDSRLHTRAH